jgi:spermidine/putrescine transport system substrate-binding protein
VRHSRRAFLTAAAPLLAAACARPGSSAAPQTFAADGHGSRVQALDPELRLAVPSAAMAASTVPSFARAFGVRVHRVPPPPAQDFASGGVDITLVDQITLAGLIQQQVIEPIDRSLVGNRRLLAPPFDNPSFDPGGRHSVPKDYSIVGIAAELGVMTPRTWAQFFHLARTLRGRIAVPDDPSVVVGAALAALGHDWNSDSGSDLDDARRLLLPLRRSLVIGGTVDHGRLDTHSAVLCTGLGFARPPLGVQFIVPTEGTIARPRLLCIPAYAPDPVTAHAWMQNALDPFVAARDTLATDRATAVSTAVYLLPTRLLGDPAVFAPSFPAVPLGFADPTPSGLEARAHIWQEMTARRGT